MNALWTLEDQALQSSKPWISLKGFDKCHWMNSKNILQHSQFQDWDNLNGSSVQWDFWDVQHAFNVWRKWPCRDLSMSLCTLMMAQLAKLSNKLRNTNLIVNLKIVVNIIKYKKGIKKKFTAI